MPLGHVRAGQFVSRPIVIAELELALSEAEMKERITDRAK
jgi:hypothetical protein